MPDNIFDTQTSEDQDKSILDELVGEGKKFATVEDLAKGKLEADAHIVQIEGENKLTREQLKDLETKSEKQATIADLIKTVQESNKQGKEDTNQLSDEDLSKKIRSIVQDDADVSTKESNLAKANKAVLDKLNGDVEAAKAYVAERAEKLGMSVAELQTLGETSPDAFHALMGTNPSTVSSSVTALPGVKPPQGTEEEIDGHKTKAYYDKLKKEMGIAKYWKDTKVQGQYTKDAMALGGRFN